MQALNVKKSINGVPFPLLTPSDHVNHLLLATAGTAESITVPTRARIARLSITDGANYWVNLSATAVLPVADVTDGSAPIQNPLLLQCDPGDTMSVVADTDGAIVGIEFWDDNED